MFQTNVRWGENGNASPQEAKDYADHTDYNVKRYALNKAQEMLERAGSRTQVQLLPASLVYGTHGNTLCVSRHGIPVYNLSNCKKIATKFIAEAWHLSYGDDQRSESRVQSSRPYPLAKPPNRARTSSRDERDNSTRQVRRIQPLIKGMVTPRRQAPSPLLSLSDQRPQSFPARMTYHTPPKAAPTKRNARGDEMPRLRSLLTAEPPPPILLPQNPTKADCQPGTSTAEKPMEMDAYSKSAHYDSNCPRKYIAFFGTSAENPYSFLSNFYDTTVQFLGHNLRGGSEQAYQYAKIYMCGSALDEEDTQLTRIEQSLTSTLSPNKAKSHGRIGMERILVSKGQIAEAWELLKYPTMVSVLVSKFGGDYLGGQLESTADIELIEANPTDMKWGVGMNTELLKEFVSERMHGQQELSEMNWDDLPGENLCGKALMEVREWNRHGKKTDFLLYTGQTHRFALDDTNPSCTTFCSADWVPPSFKLRVANVLAHEYVREVAIEFSLHEFLPPKETRPPEVVFQQLQNEILNLSRGPKNTTFLLRRMPWALSGSTGIAALQQSAFAWDGAFGNIMNASALWKNIKWEGSFCKTTEPPTLAPPMLGQEKERPLQEDYDPSQPLK